jgi:hypothetical protein
LNSLLKGLVQWSRNTIFQALHWVRMDYLPLIIHKFQKISPSYILPRLLVFDPGFFLNRNHKNYHNYGWKLTHPLTNIISWKMWAKVGKVWWTETIMGAHNSVVNNIQLIRVCDRVLMGARCHGYSHGKQYVPLVAHLVIVCFFLFVFFEA